MNEAFSRTISLIGEENFNKLKNANILLIGVGGVGGYVLEALVRSGIEKITIIDGDNIAKSNLNRQIIATIDEIGKDKVEVAKTRAESINKNVKITAKKEFLTPENLAYTDFSHYDFVVDAIDFTPTKIAIIEKAKAQNINIISSMGTGNKLHPEKFSICDISKTETCPLAKKIRQELKKKNIKNVPVLFSRETPVTKGLSENGKQVPASIATIPSIAGLMIANYVILNLIEK